MEGEDRPVPGGLPSWCSCGATWVPSPLLTAQFLTETAARAGEKPLVHRSLHCEDTSGSGPGGPARVLKPLRGAGSSWPHPPSHCLRAWCPLRPRGQLTGGRVLRAARLWEKPAVPPLQPHSNCPRHAAGASWSHLPTFTPGGPRADLPGVAGAARTLSEP